MAADGYQRSAEYIDIMLAEPWEQLGPLVVTALDGFDPRVGPVVDVGAGTGRGVLAVARALPEAEIVAVEPSAAMRAVLMARVGADEDLRHRVTVIPGDLASVPTTGRFGAVLAINMVGHLDPAARQRCWATLAARLAPGAPAVLNLQPPAEAVEVPEVVLSAVVVGRRTYEGTGRAEPTGADQVMWHMTYRTVEDGVTVAEERVDYVWWVLPEARLRHEAHEAGLLVTQVGAADAGIYVLRTSADQ